MRSETECSLGAFLPDLGSTCDADPYDKASSWGALRILAALLVVALVLWLAVTG